MHVKTKQIALGGVCLALAMVLLFVGSTIEVGSFGFICVSAFIIGIVILSSGLGMGAVYLAASILLGFLIAPSKLHVISYTLVEGYLFLRECIYELIVKKREMGKRAYLLMKLGVYLLLIPVPAAIFPTLIYSGELSLMLRIGIPVGAALFFVILDGAYDMFMQHLCSTRLIRNIRQ